MAPGLERTAPERDETLVDRTTLRRQMQGLEHGFPYLQGKAPNGARHMMAKPGDKCFGGEWVICPRCKGSGDQRGFWDKVFEAYAYCDRCNGRGHVFLPLKPPTEGQEG